MSKKSSLSGYIKKMDLFSTNITFRESGGDSFGSIFGAFASLIIITLVTLYGLQKYLVMSNHEDTRFNEFTV